MPFAELYCRSADGSNLNAGSTNVAAASQTYASGSWVQATRVFTVASGNPVADGVIVGDLASVYADGSTITGFTGYVTAVTTTTITVHATRSSGTAPVDGTSNRTLKVAGAWKGPNAAVGFPFGFIGAAQTNDAGETPRVTMIGTFNVTAAMTHNVAGPVMFQGATATAGDGGRAIIDGGTTGAGYTLLTVTGAQTHLTDLTFQNNGTTGNSSGVFYNTGSDRSMVRRVICSGMRGAGINVAVNYVSLIQCLTYGNVTGNAAVSGGTTMAGVTRAVRCVSRDNPGSNVSGFVVSSNSELINCVTARNGADGVLLAAITGQNMMLFGTEIYNNVRDGIRIMNGSIVSCYIEDCNIVLNGGWGVNGTGASNRSGIISNCGFGSGTKANTLGTTTGLSSIEEIGSVVYPADSTPWTNPDADNFAISLAQAKGAGTGIYPPTFSTTGFPDRGAAQHQETTSGDSSRFPAFTPRIRRIR